MKGGIGNAEGGKNGYEGGVKKAEGLGQMTEAFGCEFRVNRLNRVYSDIRTSALRGPRAAKKVDL